MIARISFSSPSRLSHKPLSLARCEARPEVEENSPPNEEHEEWKLVQAHIRNRSSAKAEKDSRESK
jgi:hypothetical protein